MSYPVTLHVAGRRCVVVGGGRIATRKVRALLDAGAEVFVIAPSCSDELRALADTGSISLADRGFVPADLDDAWLAVSATDQPEVARAVAAAAEERRVWCNAAELPEVSSWTSANVVRQGDITVTVSTDGRSPALAAWLAGRLEAEIGPEYSQVLDLLAEERAALQAAGIPTDTVDWRRALEGGMIDLLRSGRVDEARELLRTCR